MKNYIAHAFVGDLVRLRELLDFAIVAKGGPAPETSKRTRRKAEAQLPLAAKVE